MTTKELENKLKISEKTCIHCPTEELAKQVLNILHQLNLKWCNGIDYTSNYNWDKHKENIVYYPFEGEFSSLNYARLIDYKVISAEEFIALHTKGEEFDKGELEGFPKEDNSQKFKVGDEVIDIITGQRGKIFKISTNDDAILPIYVSSNEREEVYYALDGRYYSSDKYPRLLHYRDDYDYSIIDFNNLPKRQDKRWRAKKEEVYYYIRFDAKGRSFTDGIRDVHRYYDNDNYNSGNYFRTEAEAKNIAQKLNTYFKQLIQGEHEHKRN